MRIRLICEGKTKDAHLRALQAEYLKRLTRFTELAVEEIRPGRSATGARDGKLSAGERQLLAKLQNSTKILLDERGREWTSAEFAAWFGRQELRARGNWFSWSAGRRAFPPPAENRPIPCWRFPG